MLIDWFTVVAQIINFLILVWLLKRFLYGPILNAIDAREQRIVSKLADADAKKNEAEKERKEFQQKSLALEKQRNSYLNQAIDEAKAEHQRLLETAHQESKRFRVKQHQVLINEQRSLQEAVSHQAREEVFAIARKVLIDLADSSLEESMIEVFIKRLREINSEERVELKSAFESSTQALLVSSMFDLPAEQVASIETAIRQIFGMQKEIQFTTSGDLVSGIEISTEGHKVGWNIDNYLVALATSLDQLLKNKSPAQVAPEVINKITNDQHG